MKIINNNNIFYEKNTILFINKIKTKFNNFITFDKIGKYKLLLLNNN